MPLAAILGICLLLSWSSANIAGSVRAMINWQTTQSQDHQTSNPAQPNATAQPPTDQQKASDQSTPATATTHPCPANSSVKSDCKPARSKGKKPKHQQKADASAAKPSGSGPTKKVVRDGGTDEPKVEFSPGLSEQQASSRRESTNSLLAASDANLKQASGRQLTPSQQDTAKQIVNYMEQAKSAAKTGDAQRAYNLALKAKLLSAELVGH